MRRHRFAPALLLAIGAFAWTPLLAQGDGAPPTDPPAEAATTEAPGGTPPAPAGMTPPPKIEASVEEIQRLIDLPSTAQLGLESDEDPTKPKTMFVDTKSILEVFGEKPVFVYFPEGVDPMIIPWVRQQIIAQELLEKGRVLAAAGDYEKAMAIYQEILDKYAATPVAPEARRELDVVRRIVTQNAAAEGGVQVTSPDQPEVMLPKAIADSTTGIMYMGPRGSQVIIFDEIVGVGDRVPRYANVTVKDIQPGLIVYEFQGKSFEVTVDGSL